MTKTWGEIFPGLSEPVQGTVASYQAAESECDELTVVAEACADEFERVSSSDSIGELGGQAADQLITLITTVDGSFQDVPPVFTTLVAIFDTHAQDLSALRQEAVTALALANTRWSASRHAEDASVNANDALRRINNQIRSLERTAGDDLTLQTQLDDLYGNRAWHQTDVSSCSTAVADAGLELGWSRTAHASLVAAELALVEHTVSCLQGVDLDDLSDPSLLGQFVDNVGGFIIDLAKNIVVGIAQFVEAIVTGDWIGALWRLSDLLECVLEVGAVVALVVAVVASGGLLAALVSVGLALMTVKLVVDVLLTGCQRPHPDTGRPMTWQELAVESAGYAFAVSTAGASGIGAKVVRPNASFPAAGRTFATNLRNVLAPSARSGQRLHGAAGAPIIEGSGRHVVEFAIDEVIIPQTQRQVESTLTALAHAERLTTKPSAWANPALLAFMRDSPMTRSGLARIDATARVVRSFSISGPSSQPIAPAFQLSGAT